MVVQIVMLCQWQQSMQWMHTFIQCTQKSLFYVASATLVPSISLADPGGPGGLGPP